jgi:predicted transcriptional regulator
MSIRENVPEIRPEMDEEEEVHRTRRELKKRGKGMKVHVNRLLVNINKDRVEDHQSVFECLKKAELLNRWA